VRETQQVRHTSTSRMQDSHVTKLVWSFTATERTACETVVKFIRLWVLQLHTHQTQLNIMLIARSLSKKWHNTNCTH